LSLLSWRERHDDEEKTKELVTKREAGDRKLVEKCVNDTKENANTTAIMGIIIIIIIIIENMPLLIIFH